ncbi:MAG: exodeoxyribonuclease VII large subunit [Gammaproteobacteria bacterium]|jgi:exodeoxyribonuclease VII large subunit
MYESDPLNDGTRNMRDVYSVSRLTAEARSLLEGSFPLLWIEGEISNLARPASGHWYFTLKDSGAQVRCAMFRNRNMHIRFRPENGMQILVRARISLYEARGEFQIIAEHMEEAGDGALRRAFEQLKQRLDKEGLFNAEHKKPLPAFPRQIGVITSATGAAIRDILTTLKRRFPALPVIVYPVPVQGTGSAEHIARMLGIAGRRRECDILILARGGGSLEDLWSFNEEVVARAIYQCPLPVVTGIGHEIDFTIADFVADQRAPTPTAAAELITPDQFALLRQVTQHSGRLQQLLQNQLQRAEEKLRLLRRHLRDPRRRVQDWSQRLDESQQRMFNAMNHHLRHSRARFSQIQGKLAQHNPVARLQAYSKQLVYLQQRGNTAITHQLERKSRSLGNIARTLETVSPLATLDRGYAIATRAQDGRILRKAAQSSMGEQIRVRLSKGQLLCKVEDIENDAN